MPEEFGAAGVIPPQGPYSQAIRAGDLLFVSGEGPLDAAGRVVGVGIEEQTAMTMRNLERILESAGAAFGDVVRATAYLASMDDYEGFNRAYGEFVQKPFPSRTCVASGGLYSGILVEIDMIAYLGRDDHDR